MSNANNSGFIGWMKKNPGMAAGTVLFIIAMIVLIGWIVNRGPKTGMGPGTSETGPVITMDKAIKVLNPANPSNVSTYTEYLTGDQTAEYIDLTVVWKNGAGFNINGVTGLKMERYTVDDSDVETVLDTKYEYTTINDFDNGSITFSGKAVKGVAVDKVIGDNFIRVSWTKTENPESAASVSWEDLTTSSAITISAGDIDTTYNTSSVTSVTIDLTSTSSVFTGSANAPGYLTFYDIIDTTGNTVKKVRVKVTDGVITLRDEAGTAFSFGDSTHTSYKFRDYMGKTIIESAVTSDTYLRVDGTTMSFVTKSDAFSTQDKLNKSLFNIKEVTLPIGSTVFCVSGAPEGVSSQSAFRMMEDGKTIRQYSDPGAASSWNKNWLTDKNDVDCSRFVIGDALGVNPKTPGRTVRCNSGRPADITDRMTPFMVMGDGNTLNTITDPGIAATWNPNWVNDSSWLDDCSDMTFAGALTKNPMTPGTTVRCSSGRPADITDRMTPFRAMEDGSLKTITDPGAAGSWNPDWVNDSAWLDDCSGITFSGTLPYKA